MVLHAVCTVCTSVLSVTVSVPSPESEVQSSPVQSAQSILSDYDDIACVHAEAS